MLIRASVSLYLVAVGWWLMGDDLMVVVATLRPMVEVSVFVAMKNMNVGVVCVVGTACTWSVRIHKLLVCIVSGACFPVDGHMATA